jgi:hypothetical protein
MGMHWFGYDTGIVGKVERNTSTFLVAVQVYYLVYVEKVFQTIELSMSSVVKRFSVRTQILKGNVYF